jgi:hypothetical protein
MTGGRLGPCIGPCCCPPHDTGGGVIDIGGGAGGGPLPDQLGLPQPGAYPFAGKN